ncbi:phage tail tape measure protein [Lentzea nigeriaca]|uniref:phage tail tape measure protein n=1 Tax=Lentzea nigeriaca TaxID=1128665 RepID=UPI0019568517|nr:phage tail tape measure protein [Lentzea nigeriaca]MBM7860419.1 TP901 family phage tail tape measure protein [Lentzea nigeriaca]
MAGLKPATGIASAFGKGLGVAIAGGTAVAAVGLKEVLRLGVDYSSQLNTLQSVTQATGLQMTQVGNLAKQLGADMTLPATSAADAAAAMTELAKGGLSVDQAMTAAKGTLQLAAAAQIDAARAAEIQSDALNQFGLAASEAGHVADVLANTANAASGEVVDIAAALKFVGPVAKTVGADIDSVATAIGLIATQGIRGEQAGTSLRGMIASLAAPSKPAAEALNTLGIKAFDASGKFVGLRAITEQLAAAKGRLTEATFTEAAATAFGNEGMTVASALASTGAKAFDDMATSVTRAGGAADVAAAQTKGLGGAWEGLKSQLETTGIGIFEAIDGPLEDAVRSAAEHIEGWNDEIVQGIETAVATGELFGPKLADAIGDRAKVVQSAVTDLVSPLAKGAAGPLNELFNTGIKASQDFTAALGNVVDAAKPVAVGIGAVAEASAEGDGAVSALGAGIGVATDALRLASTILVPVGSLIGGLVRGFGELPGPVQSAVVALVAFRVAQRALGDTTALSGLRQFAGEMRVQQGLAAASGQDVGKLSAAMAAYRTSTVPAVAAARSFTDQVGAVRAGAAAAGQPISTMSAAMGTLVERTPALSAMRSAFQEASAGAERFGTAAGIASAAGTGLKSAAGGLVSALGGPFGLAIGAVSVGLSLLAGTQEKAAEAARRHASFVDNLAQALRESNGVIDANVRASQAKALQDEKIADTETKVVDSARQFGITLDDITDATLNQGSALDGLRAQLEGVIKASTSFVATGKGATVPVLTGQGQAAKDLLDEINRLARGFGEAERDSKELDAAIKNGTAHFTDATSSGRALSQAIKEFGSNTASAEDRVRSLKSALDALSGGEISLEAAQSRVQESLSRINETFKLTGDETQDAAVKAKGWGKELLNAQGGLNLTTENGRRLRDMLRDLSDNTAEVAARTFDMAIAQGDDVPAATAKARAAMQEARDAFIGAAGAMGISAKEAEVLADKAGLIPKNVKMIVSTPGSDTTKTELIAVKALADKVPADKPITVRSLSDEAKKKLEDLGFTVRTLPDGKVEIRANTATAQSQLDSYIADNSNRRIIVRVDAVGAPISVRGQYGAALNALGNIIPAQRFAQGGLAAAKLFQAGVPQIFPPRMLRITGDRLIDDEAYIPINRSSRSVALLDETAQRMGFALIRRYAQGGFAAAPTPSVQSMTLDGLAITGRLRVDSDGFGTLIDARISSAMDAEAREVRYRGGRA